MHTYNSGFRRASFDSVLSCFAFCVIGGLGSTEAEVVSRRRATLVMAGVRILVAMRPTLDANMVLDEELSGIVSVNQDCDMKRTMMPLQASFFQTSTE